MAGIFGMHVVSGSHGAHPASSASPVVTAGSSPPHAHENLQLHGNSSADTDKCRSASCSCTQASATNCIPSLKRVPWPLRSSRCYRSNPCLAGTSQSPPVPGPTNPRSYTRAALYQPYVSTGAARDSRARLCHDHLLTPSAVYKRPPKLAKDLFLMNRTHFTFTGAAVASLIALAGCAPQLRIRFHAGHGPRRFQHFRQPFSEQQQRRAQRS